MSAARLSASYNVLVVGEDFTGLIFAALAAREGYRVAVLGQDALPNHYRHEGITFLRRPERLFGLSSSPVVSHVFSRLAMGVELRNLDAGPDPVLQVVLPDRRLDISRSPSRWHAELQRELPESVGVMQAFEAWAERWSSASDPVLLDPSTLPPEGLRAAQTYRKRIAGCEALIDQSAPDGISPLSGGRGANAARALVDGILGQWTGIRSSPLPPLAVARMWTRLKEGAPVLHGGLDGLRERIIRRLLDQCGVHRQDASLAEIILKRGRPIEVVLADRSERLGCDVLVANTDPMQVMGTIPQGQRIESLHNRLLARVPSAWRVTVNVAVDPHVIPVGMGRQVTMLGPAGTAPSSDDLWITRFRCGDQPRQETRPSDGVLMLTGILPARGRVPTPTDLVQAAHRMLTRLSQLVPWLKEHLQMVHIPALIEDPRSGRRDVDLRALSPVYDRPLPMMAGVGTLNPVTPYKNVLLSGDELFGGLALEGACVGALQTLHRVRRLIKQKPATARL